MAVSQQEYDETFRWRQQLLATVAGRETLQDLLRGLGLFQPVDEIKAAVSRDPGCIRSILSGLTVLAQLGVWRTYNFGRLIDAMSKLPMPDIEGKQSGETTR